MEGISRFGARTGVSVLLGGSYFTRSSLIKGAARVVVFMG
jgi:hypothetical protein